MSELENLCLQELIVHCGTHEYWPWAVEHLRPECLRRITRDEIYCTDEAFFTGTAAEVIPIRELDRRRIGTGQRGPVTRQLQQDFLATVRGQNSAHTQWLTPVALASEGPASSP